MLNSAQDYKERQKKYDQANAFATALASAKEDEERRKRLQNGSSFSLDTEDNDTIGDIASLGGDVYSAFNGGSGYGGLISGLANSGKEAINGGSFRDDVPQSFFGIDNENDSDVMQALKGASKGATMGMTFGPIGAAIGGVLGLGASFLDDI